MSERTFRAVVAAVLVAALVLAAVVAVAILYRPTPPVPIPSPAPTTSPSLAPSPTATVYSGPVFTPPGVVSVGLIRRGSSSANTLVLEFVESQADAIPDAPGAFQVILADSAGEPSSVAFQGTPNVVAPGSLGVTVVFAAPNILEIEIEAADTRNIETITISGLSVSASATAATGPLSATADGFRGSLQGGIARHPLPTPGFVTEAR